MILLMLVVVNLVSLRFVFPWLQDSLPLNTKKPRHHSSLLLAVEGAKELGLEWSKWSKFKLQVLGLLSIYFEHFISSQKEIKPAKIKETQNQFASVTKVKGSAIKTFYLQRKMIKKLEVKSGEPINAQCIRHHTLASYFVLKVFLVLLTFLQY